MTDHPELLNSNEMLSLQLETFEKELEKIEAPEDDKLVEERLRGLADELRQKHDVDSLVITADLAQLDACRMIVKRLEQENIVAANVRLEPDAGFGVGELIIDVV